MEYLVGYYIFKGGGRYCSALFDQYYKFFNKEWSVPR